MSKIVLYVLSLGLLFNNAYTDNPTHYNINNGQPNLDNRVQPIQKIIDNTKIIHQPSYIKNQIVQQDTINNPKAQQNINIKNQNNNTTLEQTVGLILNKISKLENEVGLILKQISNVKTEQEKVNTKIEQQQKENDKLVQQALNDFYSSQARTLITPDGNGQIITESDINPDELLKYSQEKYSPNSSTLSGTNIISPS